MYILIGALTSSMNLELLETSELPIRFLKHLMGLFEHRLSSFIMIHHGLSSFSLLFGYAT